MNKSFSLPELILVFTVTTSTLMTAIALDLTLVAAILPGLILLSGLCYRKGFSGKTLMASAGKGLKRNKDVALLLVFIGILLPTWHYSGTISDLNSVFLAVISPDYFFVIAFLVTAVMSLIVGTAVGSLSIVGIPIMAAAGSLDMPAAIAAGALVSGAFVGDRTSPLSSSFFLLSYSVELAVRDHLRTIVPTMLVTLTVTAIVFLSFDILGGFGGTAGHDAPPLTDLISFQLAVSLLPPAVLLTMIILGKNMKQSFSLSIITAGVILLLRGVPFSEWFHGAALGVDTVGGVADMMSFVVFILLVGIYSQLIEDTKLIQPYLEKVFTNKRSLPVNTVQTVAVASGVSLISPNQSFPIILTGRALLPHWREHFSARQLARILSDSTVVFAGLVPWSLLAILCSTIIGVPVIYYLPYAFFLLLSPAVTIIWSFAARKL